MERNQNIEKRILWVAERLFLEKGFSGTSTTEIAKAVGCNQALIHYYFRTKEKLFWDVFSPKVEQVVEYLDAPLDESIDFIERIRNVIDFYFGILELDERLAPFIVNELIMHPGRWDKFRDRYLRNESRSSAFNRFESMVAEEIQAGHIRSMRAIDLLMNIMSLTISAFIVAPKGFASGECDSNLRKAYLDNRREDIKALIVNGIRA
ncbi:MAG: TetR/AcrR family transcriptional regulator [Bacteroidales bacterium]|nr:TetR/AcrR family transcriptional regulator [Bacteroidales bacterium]MBO5075139.1 TetR/AcrR family transcriptional regulator [Bacteroidales bacterium]MBR1959094.1 TetR/AcrR family transcriptional regulator [Bacteroidales bacterium]